MNDFQLRPRSKLYTYDIEGHLEFQLNGRIVRGLKYMIEHDKYHSDQYVMRIFTDTDDHPIFEGLERGNWPTVARRLFEAHMRVTGQW